MGEKEEQRESEWKKERKKEREQRGEGCGIVLLKEVNVKAQLAGCSK